MQQSALLQMNLGTDNPQTGEMEQEPFAKGLKRLDDIFSGMAAFRGGIEDLLEPLVEISNLRLEQEKGDDHLRFSVDALAPAGLTAVDESGHGTTLFPQEDGSLGKMTDPQLQTVV